MPNPVNIRAVVLSMLLEEENDNSYSHVLLNDVLKKYDYLDVKEKAFLKRLFEGCIERRIELDFYLNHFSKTKTEKMKPIIRNSLRMAVYQLLYMDSVPDSAAINESVKLIQKRGLGGLAGFANGVLRSLLREKDHVTLPDKQTNPAGFLAVHYSMPEWLVDHFISQYGFEQTETIFQSTLLEKPVTIRIDENLSEDEKKNILSKLGDSGAEVSKHPYLSYAYKVSHAEGIQKLPGFTEGKIFISDVSSMLVVELAGIQKGDYVLDVCAAPGGKTLHAASKLNHTGEIWARDLSPAKTQKIQENVDRSTYQNIHIEVSDATIPTPEFHEKMDVVIVDAPCSGLGVIGKKQDIKYHVQKDTIDTLKDLQKTILKCASEYVKPGGILMYSTCTVTKEENEQNRDWILSNLPMQEESFEEFLPQELRGLTGSKGYLQLLPGIHDTDGFFISRFRKKG